MGGKNKNVEVEFIMPKVSQLELQTVFKPASYKPFSGSKDFEALSIKIKTTNTLHSS
jgi:hypothetical protein